MILESGYWIMIKYVLIVYLCTLVLNLFAKGNEITDNYCADSISKHHHYIGISCSFGKYAPKWFISEDVDLTMHPSLYGIYSTLSYGLEINNRWLLLTGIGYNRVWTENHTFRKPRPYIDQIKLIHLPIGINYNLFELNNFRLYIGLGTYIYWLIESRESKLPLVFSIITYGYNPTQVITKGKFNLNSFMIGGGLKVGCSFNLREKVMLRFEGEMSNNFPILDKFPGNGYSYSSFSIGCFYKLN